ncbi:MAG TPA: TrkH family potassium uptake protein [Longimicrobiaceae bacterium]|nr:TrkH family potassium uptake protein [Longimicrobiaceae bacterium]
MSPPQLFVGSFLLLILLGTVGLKTLPGLYTGDELRWLDALFTATSAVCVTGLIVVDTATYFTPAGQAFVLLLIQLGGLGMLTLSTLIILALGRRLSLRQEAATTSSFDVIRNLDREALTRNIVLYTLLIEAVGAILLYALWIPRLGWTGALWPAVFHSISAFCNAGFSTFSDSLMSFQTAPFSLFVIMSLIILGGIGFITLEEIYLRRRARRGDYAFRISIHSRIVLATTGLLVFGGSILFTLFEWTVTLAELPIWAKLLNGLFMSVTARTAGFNAIDYSQAADSSNFLTILLMSVGGSPGSTAGGLKTTTVAIICLLAWSRFRGVETTSIWGRTIPEETIQRAIGLFVMVFGLVTLAIFIFTSTEIGRVPHLQAGGSFLRYMFEAASAFNTVGLSMGVTADLSTPGRWLTILLMYVGRVGPLTFAAAIALRRNPIGGKFRFGYEDVVVG